MRAQRNLRILLIGNYAPMRQQSMLRFAELMRRLYVEAGHEVRLLQPVVVLGRLTRHPERGLGKWLGYVDRFVLFRVALRRALAWADVVHVCDHSSAMIVPWLRGKPHLVTCHDVLAIRGATGRIDGYRVGPSGRVLQRWILAGLRRAEHVVCDSLQTRQELQEMAEVPDARVSVVPVALNHPYCPMAVGDAAARIAVLGLDPQSRYVLHVGGNDWYKNRPGVVRIFAELVRQQGYEAHHLVLAGKAWDATLAAAVEGSGLAERVHAVIDADNETLRALYSRADFLLFPSLAEGFGWPIAEAMACGCPVVTTGRPPMTEVGGEAALYLDDPDDAAGSARRIVHAMEPRERRVALGLAQTARFDAAAMQAGYLAAIAQVTAGGG